jgi:hypothetical protein
MARQSGPFEPTTAAAIDHAQHVFEEIIKLTPDSLGSDARSTLLMAFGSLAMEHFRSIIMLCRSGVATGSALALFRPLVEAVVRGEWLYFCASEEQMNLFMKNEFSLHKIGFAAMANAVDEKVGLGARLALYLPDYAKLCDYTHAGHDAVVQRLANDGGIEPTYPESRVRALVSLSSQVLVQHYEIVCNDKGHQASVKVLVKLFDTIQS